MSLFITRREKEGEVDAITDLVGQAFAEAPVSDGNEAEIVCKLREQEGLILSLVAELSTGEIIGYIAFSLIHTQEKDLPNNWLCLAPVAVHPRYQKLGVGSRLIRDSLEKLTEMGYDGATVLGSPDYYIRFGFIQSTTLKLADVPLEYFMVLKLRDDALEPVGHVKFHNAFNIQ
ncbi:hypothetical protein PCE1_001294 [Barthelona sp. PCE]